MTTSQAVVRRLEGAVGAVIVEVPSRRPAGALPDWPVRSCGADAHQVPSPTADLDSRVAAGFGTVVVQCGDLLIGDRNCVIVLPSECRAAERQADCQVDGGGSGRYERANG